MAFLLLFLLCCVISYLLGGLPFGLWVGLIWKRTDIRTLGSKNIGATNVLRVLGPGPAAVAFVLDTLKGAAGIMLAHLLLPELYFALVMLIGFCAILGHTFSPFLGFKGGKGVATSLGMLLACCWQVAVVALLSWIVVVAITRYVSLASLVAAFSLPFTAYLMLRGDDQWWMVGFGVALAVLVTLKHRANIHRLLNGTESKIGQRAEVTPETAEVR